MTGGAASVREEARGSAPVAFANAGLNLVAGLLPVPLALVTVPAVIAGFGVERYGVLATAGVVLAYVGLLDLGLARAGTRFLARSLDAGDAEATATTFWTVAALALAIGLVGATAVAALAGPLTRLVRIPAAITADARAAFSALALAAPFAILLPALLGALEARRRFDLVAAIQVPATVLGLLAPLLVLPWTTRLVAVIVAIAGVQALACVAALAACRRAIPDLRHGARVRPGVLRRLVDYGRWVAISNVVGPLMVNADRLAIGAVISVRAVSFYAAPYELVTRMTLVPGSLMRALFPLFSADRSADPRDARVLAVRGAQAVALVMGPAAVLLVSAAPDLLHAWLGAEFARRSTPTLQLLAVGVAVNAMAMVPFWLLQGLGRPDVCAKFHLLELALYVPMLFACLAWWGITGAAAAWTLRVTLDAALLVWATHRLVGAGEQAPQVRRLFAYGACVALALAASWFGATRGTATIRLGGAVALAAAVSALAWLLLFTAEERGAIFATAASRLRRGA